jgi:hypothetical protein
MSRTIGFAAVLLSAFVGAAIVVPSRPAVKTSLVGLEKGDRFKIDLPLEGVGTFSLEATFAGFVEPRPWMREAQVVLAEPKERSFYIVWIDVEHEQVVDILHVSESAREEELAKYKEKDDPPLAYVLFENTSLVYAEARRAVEIARQTAPADQEPLEAAWPILTREALKPQRQISRVH